MQLVNRSIWISMGMIFLLTACQAATGSGSSIELAGTSWQMTTLDEQQPVIGTSVILQFADGDVATGSDGCNNFRRGYTQDGSSLEFDQAGPSTLIACEEPVMAQAATFSEALQETSQFSTIDENTLILNDGSNDLATFSAIAQDLVDSNWIVTGYNNGRQAVVSVIVDTEITMAFGDDGQVTGDSGCNSYFASFEADEGVITVGPAGMTEMACLEPEGVMDQEMEFLNALQSAATYTVSGNTLEMRTSADQLAISATRAP